MFALGLEVLSLAQRQQLLGFLWEVEKIDSLMKSHVRLSSAFE